MASFFSTSSLLNHISSGMVTLLPVAIACYTSSTPPQRAHIRNISIVAIRAVGLSIFFCLLILFYPLGIVVDLIIKFWKRFQAGVHRPPHVHEHVHVVNNNGHWHIRITRNDMSNDTNLYESTDISEDYEGSEITDGSEDSTDSEDF